MTTREAIVAEALSWIGTPYKSNAMVKGVGGGTDCAMLLVGVYAAVGLLPDFTDPRPYPPFWHVHRNEEKYLGIVLQHSYEIPAPPLPGDMAMFQIGKLFAHGGIVIDWPRIVHAIGNSYVLLQDVSKQTTGKRALARVPQRFFSKWNPNG